ncbi:MAG: HAMP domain-containing histidine kinase [Chloroflexi bacterium]|nr:MAG: HAMP domain-containing histidine kinase [Chloroflexota bacterium]
MSLRLRLALFGAAVVALALVLFGLAVYGLVARSVETNQDKELQSRARAAVAGLTSTPAPDLAPRPPVAPVDLRSSTEVFVEVLARDGSVIYSTGVLGGAPPAVPSSVREDAVRKGGAFATEGDAKRGTQLRFFVQPFAGGYVVTGQSTRVPQSNLSGIVGFLIISGVPTLVAALVASWLVAGRALKPLKEVAGAADDIGRTRDFGRRLASRPSRDEVALLAASFNRMLEELQDAYRGVGSALEAQRRFVADASHELRTPLTTIQGNAGLLAQGPPISEPVRRAAAADIAAESERMARLVDRMLTLARADSGLQLELTAVGLRSLLGEVCRQAGAVHPETKITFNAVDATVAGDEDALRQLAWILLDNAMRHARSAISVSVSVDGEWARLMVGDDGAGIPPADRDRVFERFFKMDAARSRVGADRKEHGAGLGLSIARWITDQHHGRIVAAESPAGGAGFFVDLPLLRSS